MVRIFTNSYGTPGDVEYKDCSKPETLAIWKELAKEALKETGFVEVEVKPTGGQLPAGKMLVNVYQVEWVAQL